MRCFTRSIKHKKSLSKKLVVHRVLYASAVTENLMDEKKCRERGRSGPVQSGPLSGHEAIEWRATSFTDPVIHAKGGPPSIKCTDMKIVFRSLTFGLKRSFFNKAAVMF